MVEDSTFILVASKLKVDEVTLIVGIAIFKCSLPLEEVVSVIRSRVFTLLRI